eukprot:TRINITY_DN5560_c0_g1_i1.p1 TRINITY_DN5560_c0_g1~~TRINITY_DN5560_c0_g1_i1.p1  ORF type:complete len:353 (+),score=150.83 TRINITY_DN5560_c0_g1_i1:226-1284(+)
MVDMVNPKITIAPLVPMSVLDHHTRRDYIKPKGTETKGQDAPHVSGALLGAVVDGVIEIRSCFPVKSSSQGENMQGINIHLLFQKEMLMLSQKIYGNERIVGWYCTSYNPAPFRPIQDHYRKNVRNCPAVCFVMDPNLKNGSLNPKCFVMTSCKIGGEEVNDLFKEIPFEWKCRNPTEKSAVDMMISNRHRCLAPLLEGLPTALQTEDLQSCAKRPVARGYTTGREGERVSFEQTHKQLLQIQAVLKKSLDYTNAVIEGKESEDPVIGRELLNLVQSMPPVATDAFDKVYHSTTQDMLMVVYLSKLTQVQVHLMERLHVYVPDQKPNTRGEGGDQRQQRGEGGGNYHKNQNQ